MRDINKDQLIEINFVNSAENDSDIMTKNQQGQHYMYAKSELVYTVQEMNEKRDTEDEETGRMLERERFSYVFPIEVSGPVRRSPDEEQTGTLRKLKEA